MRIRKNEGRIIILLMMMVIWVYGQKDQTVVPEIYGVRWALGQHFQFTVGNNPNNEYYVVIFNSDRPISGELFINISQVLFSCSSSFLTTEAVEDHHTDVNTNASQIGDIEQTYLHKCIISNIDGISDGGNKAALDYSIELGNLEINTSKDATVTKPYKVVTLFSGTFRLPKEVNGRMDILVIGDWGVLTNVGLDKGYNEVFPCICKQIEQNSNIRMLLFTGDMAYDLQGPHYRSMLNMISYISSKMVFMVTPGNHDTFKHDDTFQLFSQSFYTPQWRQYNNYFYTMKIGKIAILAYNPQLEIFDFEGVDRLGKDLVDVFRKELTDQIVKNIQEQYFSIVFSHYPIYCSNIYDDQQNCDVNEARLLKYREYFNNMNVDLYLSGHVHAYERSKPICFNGSFPQSNEYKVNSSCPVYIVEGCGGNDLYVQIDQQYPMKNYSAKLLYNTGFGLLSILSDNYSNHTTNATYQHLDGGSCTIKDEFVMINSQASSEQPWNPSNQSPSIFWIMLKTSVIIFSVIAAAVIFVKLYLRYKNRRQNGDRRNQQQNHVEMVEEQMEAPQSNSNRQSGSS